MPPTMQQVELRFSATNLANMDFLSLSDPFLVCHAVHNNVATEEIGRTETIKDDLNPVWTTTITFNLASPTTHTRSQILVDIFDRDSASDRRLTRHDFLGSALLSVRDLLRAPYQRLDIPLASVRHLGVQLSSADREYAPAALSARAARRLRGTLSVTAEVLHPGSDLPIVFRVSSAMLRDAGVFGYRVTQFYELQRERPEADGSVSWSCVYRSEDGVNVDRNNYVVFDEMSVTDQQLHNMDPDRILRLAFYKRHTRVAHELISYIVTSVSHVLKTSRRGADACIPLEGMYGDEDGLGNVMIRHVERVPLAGSARASSARASSARANFARASSAGDSAGGSTGGSTRASTHGSMSAEYELAEEDSELHIHLRADHFLHTKFISSLNDQPRSVRRLRQLPSFISMH